VGGGRPDPGPAERAGHPAGGWPGWHQLAPWLKLENKEISRARAQEKLQSQNRSRAKTQRRKGKTKHLKKHLLLVSERLNEFRAIEQLWDPEDPGGGR
jgi:hypothetical protein